MIKGVHYSSVVMEKCKKEIPREVLVDGVLVKCHQYSGKVK